MLSILLGIAIFFIISILQSAIVSVTPLLQGTADLVMLTIIAWALQSRVKYIWQWTLIGGMMIGFISKMPFFMTILAYFIVTGISIIAKQKLWKVPYLVMGVVTVVGTIIVHGITLIVRWLEGTGISVLPAFNLIILPSLLLNLLVAIPVLAIIRDLANWLYPAEVIV